jgi:hypothetical protein
VTEVTTLSYVVSIDIHIIKPIETVSPEAVELPVAPTTIGNTSDATVDYHTPVSAPKVDSEQEPCESVAVSKAQAVKRQASQ